MRSLRSCVSCLGLGLVVAFGSWGCVSSGDRGGGGGELRHEINSEFGALDDETIEGFERELRTQYDQLHMTYDEFDSIRQAPPGVVDNDHDEHRLHLKLERRHRTLARLHEDRMWLHVTSNDGPSARDRQLAEAHRSAAHWHEDRYRENGHGIEDQDAELETLRETFDRAETLFAE